MAIIKPHVGTWSKVSCAVDNCAQPINILLGVEASWDPPSSEPRPRRATGQWSDYTYPACNEHALMVVNYLLARGFKPNMIKNEGEIKKIDELRKQAIAEDAETERRRNEGPPPSNYRRGERK